MSAVMTYSSLVTDLRSYAQRGDDAYIAQIPRMIMLAENEVITGLKVLGFQSTATGTLNSNSTPPGIVAKPAYWKENQSFRVIAADGTSVQLFPRTLEVCRQTYPDPSAKGIPRFYADAAFTQFLVVPTPIINYTFEIVYYARNSPLDTTNQVNWLTENAPQLLLYQCLVQSALWRKNATEMQTWSGMYAASREAFVGEDARRIADRTTLAIEPQ